MVDVIAIIGNILVESEISIYRVPARNEIGDS